MVGIESHDEHIHDSKTLTLALASVYRHRNTDSELAVVDQGYRGAKQQVDIDVLIPLCAMPALWKEVLEIPCRARCRRDIPSLHFTDANGKTVDAGSYDSDSNHTYAVFELGANKITHYQTLTWSGTERKPLPPEQDKCLTGLSPAWDYGLISQSY